MVHDERMIFEALEALHYCTTDFLPESEIVQSACPRGGASKAVISRFKNRMSIAKKLGYLELVRKGKVNLLRLSEAGNCRGRTLSTQAEK
jgi:hypothetical protein